MQPRIARAIHLAHAAGAEERHDLITAEPSAGRERHQGSLRAPTATAAPSFVFPNSTLSPYDTKVPPPAASSAVVLNSKNTLESPARAFAAMTLMPVVLLRMTVSFTNT